MRLTLLLGASFILSACATAPAPSGQRQTERPRVFIETADFETLRHTFEQKLFQIGFEPAHEGTDRLVYEASQGRERTHASEGTEVSVAGDGTVTYTRSDIPPYTLEYRLSVRETGYDVEAYIYTLLPAGRMGEEVPHIQRNETLNAELLGRQQRMLQDIKAHVESVAPFSGETAPVPVYAPAPDLYSPREESALVAITVSPAGRVVDARLEDATNRAYGDAAVASAREWIFRPGQRGGAPAAVQTTIRFESHSPAFQDHLNQRAGRPIFLALDEHVHPMEELDFDPVILELRADDDLEDSYTALYPRRLAGSGREGNVRLRVVVTPEGRAINPQVLDFDDPEFVLDALAEMIAMRFSPGTINRRPVHASFDFTIHFREDAARR